MSEEFDPYLKWLGIPPKHQPPHHYRLLGLEAFEKDPDAIENAADRQMAHLRTFRNGKRVDVAERLLNEIAEAKVCLLNQEKKVDYDAKLRAIEAKRKAAEAKKNGNGRAVKAAKSLEGEAGDAPRRKIPSGPSAKGAVAAPVATAAAPPPKPAVVEDEPATSPMLVGAARGSGQTRRRKQTPWIAIAVLVVIGVGVLAVGAVVAPSLLNPPVEVAVGDDGGTIHPTTVNNGSDPTNSDKPGSSGSDSSVTPTVGEHPNSKPPITGVKPTGNGDGDDGDHAKPWRDPRQHPPKNPPRENPAGEDGGEDGDNGGGDTEEGGTEQGGDDGPLHNTAPLPGTGGDDGDSPPATEIVKRKPAPAADAQKEIETRVRNLYKFTAATTPEEQGVLAKKLVADAAETRDNPDDQFVMLRVAAETAAGRADVATAMQAIDTLAANFEIEAVPLRMKLVEQAAKATAPPAERAQALRDALPVLDAALAENKFAEIDALVTALLASARRLNDRDLNASLIERRKTALTMKKQYDKAIAALDTLKANADDPIANGVVGSFWAFVKDNWDKGLPHLAKGDDAAAADAAKRELAQSERGAASVKGEDIAKLADDWFALAQKQEAPAKQNLLRHAASLYQKAESEVTGLTKTSVQQQLAEIEKQLAAAGAAAGATQPVSRMAHLTVSCDSSFELYINGEYVSRGDREEITSFDRELKSGDVLLAMGANLRRERGFAAVIKFEADGKTIVTGQANAWYVYTPASTEAWYDPRGVTGIAAPRLGDGDRHQRIEEQTGIRSQSIWGNNQFRSFFVLRIP